MVRSQVVYPLAYRDIADAERIELSLLESESSVLPLHQAPIVRIVGLEPTTTCVSDRHSKPTELYSHKQELNDSNAHLTVLETDRLTNYPKLPYKRLRRDSNPNVFRHNCFLNSAVITISVHRHVNAVDRIRTCIPFQVGSFQDYCSTTERQRHNKKATIQFI